MKYIFLLLLLVAAQSAAAQPASSASNPTFYTDNVRSSQGTAGSEEYNFGTGGAEEYYSGTAGGEYYSGTAGAQQNYSGTAGAPRALQELNKPNLTVVGITNWFIQILNYVAILIFTAALVCFLYGVFLLMFVHGTSDESRSKGKKFMTWGIVSLFVMVSTWGLVNVLKTSIFGSGPLILPQLK